MAIEFVPYSPDWEPAVARFNQRMKAGNAPSAFGLPEKAVPVSRELVFAEHYLAVEGDEVRGGVLILEHPAWFAGTGSESGRHETVLNLQSPLSEGIIDPRYMMVSIQLIRFALKRCPRVYVVGMGDAENPLPRLLKASGWTVRAVPFYFRLLNAFRCLTQLEPLQRPPVRKAAGQFAAWTGLGAAALAIVQRSRASAAGYRAEKAEGPNADDDAAWRAVEKQISFGVIRDSSTLPRYLSPKVERFRVTQGNRACGWFSLLVSPMRNHSYFGNLTVATLIDLVAANPADLAAFAVLASRCAEARGADLVVSNQLHNEHQKALIAAGFQTYRSNFQFGSSKVLSAEMDDTTGFLTRQDGDGLVNLHA